MLTCRKTYHDIPFAHRQHKHDGHCAQIHGHNWSFTFTFGCEELDENGFVIDFGKLQFLREWLENHLDHACVFNEDDPLADRIIQSAPEAFKVYRIPNCSCEGIATHLWTVLNPLVQEKTNGRVRILSVEVEEDRRNAARFTP